MAGKRYLTFLYSLLMLEEAALNGLRRTHFCAQNINKKITYEEQDATIFARFLSRRQARRARLQL